MVWRQPEKPIGSAVFTGGGGWQVYEYTRTQLWTPKHNLIVGHIYIVLLDLGIVVWGYFERIAACCGKELVNVELRVPLDLYPKGARGERAQIRPWNAVYLDKPRLGSII